MFNRTYSLRKSKSILQWVHAWYEKKGKTLNPTQLSSLEADMTSLDEAILRKDKEGAAQIAQRLEDFGTTYCKKSIFRYGFEILCAVLFALILATVIRQMWFELYEIPTGSMRPTFREQDHLTVTKTAFGLNVPLKTEHFYFDPHLVQRTGVVILSGDGIPMLDSETSYFGVIPYTKRYIKRLIGKPGDSLYFYGGQLWGVDKEGKEISELRTSPWMEKLDHVPFITFDGTLSGEGNNAVVVNQMSKPAGKVTFSKDGKMSGQVYDGKTWINDDPIAQQKSHSTIQTYSDIMGIRNFGMARLLTKDELKDQNENITGLEEGVLYLQIHHTPSLSYPSPMLQHANMLGIPGYSTIIPLQQRHLDAIMDNMYTARFVVEHGKAKRYSAGDSSYTSGNSPFPAGSPRMSNVPNGTYEFYYGKASAVKWGGIEFAVPDNSPLYSRDAGNVQKLFNLGIEMNTAYSPHKHNQTLFPHRYVYFRDGDLYLMGAPIIKKDDPTLKAFNVREKWRQDMSSQKAPYVAFKQYPAPVKEDGSIDVDFIRTFGVTVPEGHYLVLGDNHAMSSDSRIFGFVPEANLQGAPSMIIWPPGSRLGPPAQKPYPLFTIPRLIVWSTVATLALLWYFYNRWKMQQPVFIKKKRLDNPVRN